MGKLANSGKHLLLAVILGVALVPIGVLWAAGALHWSAALLAAAGTALLGWLAWSWLTTGEPPVRSDGTFSAAQSGSGAEDTADPDGRKAAALMAQAAELVSEPSQLFAWLTQLLAELVGADRCVLLWCQEQRGAGLQAVTPAYGFTARDLTLLENGMAGLATSLAGLHDPLVLSQPGPNRQFLLIAGERNLMLVPLAVNSQPGSDRGRRPLIGWARLTSRRKTFGAEDVRLVRRAIDRLAPILDNVRQQRLLQSRLDELSLLYEVGAPLAGVLDFDQAVAQAIQAIQSVLGAEHVNLFLVDESSETLDLHRASPFYASGGGQVSVSIGRGVIGRVAETGEPLTIADLVSQPDALSLVSGACSELCVPLKLGSWVIGVVDVQSRQPNAYREKDVQLLSLVAGQLGSLLQSARLTDATRQRAAELSLLYDATVAISTAEMDQTGIIALVMKRLIQAAAVDGGRLALWESGTNVLVTRYAQGLTLMAESSGLPPRPADVALERKLMTGRKPLTLYQDDPFLEPAVAEIMVERGVDAALVLPLLVHNRVVGLIELSSRNFRHRFSAEEVRLALTLATQAAIVLENARLYQETKQAVEELAALQALALDITAQVSLPELLERLMMRARHLVRAAGSAIYLLEARSGRLAVAACDLASETPLHPVVGQASELARQVVENGRPLCQPVGPAGSLPAGRWDSGVLSCASVPLRWREEVVGVLSVFRPETDASFAAQELYLLELLAPQAAIAIRNVQLYEALDMGVRELEQAQANLVQAEKAAAIGRLAASLAHEINNPLQSLNNCLHLTLRLELESEKRSMYLSMAKEEVERLIAIVNRLLNFYRPATGETRTETDVNQLLEDVLALVRNQLEHSKIRTELNLDRGLPHILAIPNNLRQVFLNVILNAVDAMPEGGTLAVSTDQPGDQRVSVSIRDTGRGIPPEHLHRIYEPFFTTKKQGTGLGLAISYGIVEAHNGQMLVDSRPDEGTRFRLIFPIGEVERE